MIIDAFLFFCPETFLLIAVRKSNLQSGSKHDALYIFQKMISNEVYLPVIHGFSDAWRIQKNHPNEIFKTLPCF